MQDVMKMAGNYTGHAFWSISSGETLIPIVGYLDKAGERRMERLAMDSTKAIALGDQKISELPDDATGAIFIRDGYITLETGKTDAIIIDIALSGKEQPRIQYMFPYRHANHEKGFALHRLKVTQLKGISTDDIEAFTNFFWDGIESHPQGGDLWKKQYQDQPDSSDAVESSGIEGEDFETLKNAPFLIFFLISAADGKIDKKEVLEFIKILSAPESQDNALMVRIITNVISSVPDRLSEMVKGNVNPAVELIKIRLILEANLSVEDAQAVKSALLDLGNRIASASGSFFGFGNKIDKKEKAALEAIAGCLGL